MDSYFNGFVWWFRQDLVVLQILNGLPAQPRNLFHSSNRSNTPIRAAYTNHGNYKGAS
jgi:hypothetical protein